MQNYICEGKRLQVTAPAGGITSGDLVLVGTKVTVAVTSAAESEVAVVATEGVYELPKATGVVTKGAAVYFDESESEVTTVAAGNVLVGYAYSAADSGDLTVQVVLTDNPATPTTLTVSANESAIIGDLTGAADGEMEDVADIALSTTNTYTDAAVNGAVNAAILATNLQLKELQTTVNSLLTKMKAAGLMVADA